MATNTPGILVFSTLFPSGGQPHAGIFIRERMFRVARQLPLVVVAPIPWFPLQGLIRRFRPHFRVPAPRLELQQDIEVHHPRFFCIPGVGKWLDGLFLALGSYRTVHRLCRERDLHVIDSHFGYPDGYAATLLGRWLGLPVAITLRGTEIRHSRTPLLRPLLVKALQRAQRIITVSDSLRRHAISLGIPADKIAVVGNGVDTQKFFPVDTLEARTRLGLPPQARFLITVGGLVERKGFHRVIELLPALRARFPDLRYLIVGGASAEGDWTQRLQAQVRAAGLQDVVHFMGTAPHERMRELLSAADLFVLSTRNEGWANVLLEAMACRLPVIATDVGGNAEVVNAPGLGRIVPFGDSEALLHALETALAQDWDHDAIEAHARANSWDERVGRLREIFIAMASGPGRGVAGEVAP
jgi:glycosyltransferase involved in cell wall biosynthesis